MLSFSNDLLPLAVCKWRSVQFRIYFLKLEQTYTPLHNSDWLVNRYWT